MERYSEYKDSGIYYIPLIPSSWNVLKGKILFKEEKRPIRQQDEIVTCFRDGQVTLRKNRRLEGFTNSLKEIGYQGIRKGDLVIHNMDAFAGAIGVSDSDGKGTPVYAVCTPIREDVNQYYYCFLLRFLAKIGFIQSLAKGIRERSTDFRYGDFKELLLPVPSRAEQDAIVRYLDAATSKIDKAIAMQQKMIDLLNERKQIIIQNAVTKGLDENVEMKDSGVEWIGMIPKHWKISKLKYLIDAPLKYGANEASDLIDYSCPRYIRITDIDANGKLKEETYRSLPMSKAESYLLKKGDLLFARSGATVGKAFLFEEDYAACYAGYLIKAHMDQHKVLPKFVYLYTQTFAYQHWKESFFIQATIQNISGEKYANMQIAIPTIEEQNNIIDMLTPKMQRFDSAITNCQRQITLLQERKQIIINEVVTGKVKVS